MLTITDKHGAKKFILSDEDEVPVSVAPPEAPTEDKPPEELEEEKEKVDAPD